MAKTYFVTGTDTNAGKTFATCAMLAAANQKHLKTLALKPLAAGADAHPDGPRNADALALQAHASVEMSYEQINPVLLQEAIAPHLAAEHERRSLSVARLTGLCRGALMKSYDLAFIEGAGGWLVPLNPPQTLADLAVDLQFPVILVVGLRLGCLNHALLTAAGIQQSGLQLAGWVGSQCQPQPMLCQAENIQTLKAALGIPCIGILPFAASPSSQEVVQGIDLSPLLQV